MPAKRPRRNSDSVVLVRSRDNEAMRFYANLRQAEIKFQEKKESVEKANEKRPSQLEESGSHAEEASTSEQTTESTSEAKSRRRQEDIQERPGLKRFRPAATSEFETKEIRAQEFEMLESPRKRRRRNSDSDLYYKAKDEEMSKRERNQEPFLGEEKYAFVQRYLENLHETHSFTTETSDSGIKTHGAPSDLGMEDISDSVHNLCYKDLSEEVISELRRRIKVDRDSARLILQSFGITRDIILQHSLENVADVFRFFPNTPVKLLKDVFEALQLYDLVELLERPVNPLDAGSLRLALSLEEIRKLRNTAGRPISYHSRAAVLIVAEDTQDFAVKGIETFFKDLNLNSKVTVIQYSGLWRLQHRKTEENSYKLLRQTTQYKISRINEQLKTETKHGAIIALKSELQSKMETLERAQKALEDLKDENEIELRAALMVIDEWIQRQDEFSFFAVFEVSDFKLFSDVIGRKLGSGIPNKTKFVVSRSREEKISEALQVSGDVVSFSLLLKILNKRWQTLDLVSIVQELRRHSCFRYSGIWFPDPLSIQDTLSYLPTFKRAEDLS